MIDKIFLSLGSNIGDRFENLKMAVHEIKENPSCRVLKSSAVYETTPYGEIVQDNFYNAVIEVETILGFFELFHFLKSVERRIGRHDAKERWGPREIDIDIVFYNDFIFDGENITIPHAEWNKRDFVVTPLLEIVEEFKHPKLKKKIKELQFENLSECIINKVGESLL